MKLICEKRYKQYKNHSGIYCVINMSNGRYYIGSAKNFRIRFNEHKRDLKNKKHSNIFLLNEYNCGKYRHNDFVFGILEIVQNKKDLISIEQKYIDHLYDKQNKCYNMCPTAGSALGRKHTEATKLKISKGNRGKVRTEEYRKRMSMIKKTGEQKTWFKSGKNNPMYGKTGQQHPNAVIVQKIDKNTNKVLATYDSYKAAGDNVGISYLCIRAAAHGKRKTAGGYKWVIVKESGLSKSPGQEVLNVPLKELNTNIISVCQIEPKTGKIVAIFESVTNASENTNIKRASISSVINKKSKTAGGFKWIKKSDLPKNIDLKADEIEILKIKPCKLGKPVQQINIETNEVIAIFNSVPEASKQTNIGRSTIANALCGRAKTAGGYKWELLIDN